MRVTAIHRYPVKSMRGQSLRRTAVEPWGLAGDRRWMVVDAAGECVTAREHPRLLLLVPELTRTGVRIAAPDRAPLDAVVAGGPDTAVSVHGRAPFAACPAGADAHAWLSDYLGTHVRLVYCDDPTRRRLNPRFSHGTDSASFADAYPVLVTTQVSLDQLNRWVADGRFPHQGPVPMNRFRPNIVVDGHDPFGEDRWRRVRIGTARFRAPKGCDRCVLTTTDADTAARGREPLATLAVHRRFDGAVWFGMNLIPDDPDPAGAGTGIITVGDPVSVLDAQDGDGPPR